MTRYVISLTVNRFTYTICQHHNSLAPFLSRFSPFWCSFDTIYFVFFTWSFFYHLKEFNKFCKSLNNFCLLFIHATLYMKFALYNSQRTENTLYGQSYMYEWHLCAILILRVDSKGQTAFLYIWMYWSNRVTRFWSLTNQ